MTTREIQNLETTIIQLYVLLGLSILIFSLIIKFNIKELKTSKSKFKEYFKNKPPFIGSILSIYILLFVCFAVFATSIYFIVDLSTTIKKLKLEHAEFLKNRKK